MVHIITTLSKYLIILLMVIYTFLNFRYFAVDEESMRRHICRLQNAAVFLIHVLAAGVIFIATVDEKLLAFFGVQIIYLFLYRIFYRLFYRNCSGLLLNNVTALLATGFIIISRVNPDHAYRQFAIVIVASVITLIIPVIIDRVWQLARIPWVYGIGGLLLLLVVCIAGNTSFGAQLSLTVGGVSVQPSEIVKLTFVFFVATMFYRSLDFKNIVITTIIAGAHVLVLVASRDLGSALIFFITYLLMLFIATGSRLYLVTGLGAGALASVMAYGLFSHVRVRIQAWQNPWSDIPGKGYQTAQSLFAIGTGGWFGMGIFGGMPRKIPVVDKDFIFAAISEEMGGVYAMCIILISLGCFVQMMLIATRMQASFYRLIAFGLGIEYIVQVFLTIGGVIKFIPLTGVTLPFVSYGGSSVLSSFVLFGVVQGLYILKRNEEEELDEDIELL